MRTTLDIADDVLFAAREIAQRQKQSIGHVISELARQAFRNPPPGLANVSPGTAASPALRVEQRLADYGIKPLAPRGGVVSNELIDRLRDSEGI